jgi:hypothetical protein
MGNFYVNHTVRAPQDCVVAFLEAEGRTAFVSPTVNGHTVVCDWQCDQQDVTAINHLGRRLSASLASAVLAVLNHDDDVLCYWLFERGHVIEEYNSCPDYFDDDDNVGLGVYSEDDDVGEDASASSSGSASAGDELCRIMGSPAVRRQVRAILAGTDTPFAMDIHQALVSALGLPTSAVGSGYRYIAEGDAGLNREACVHVGQRAASRWGHDFAGDEDE